MAEKKQFNYDLEERLCVFVEAVIVLMKKVVTLLSPSCHPRASGAKTRGSRISPCKV